MASRSTRVKTTAGIVATFAVALLIVLWAFGGGVFLIFPAFLLACAIGMAINARSHDRPRNEGGSAVSSGPR